MAERNNPHHHHSPGKPHMPYMSRTKERDQQAQDDNPRAAKVTPMDATDPKNLKARDQETNAISHAISVRNVGTMHLNVLKREDTINHLPHTMYYRSPELTLGQPIQNLPTF